MKYASTHTANAKISRTIHGVTSHVFRNAWFRHFTGLDSAMIPFIASIHSDSAHESGKRKHFRDILPENNLGISAVPQVMGNEPTIADCTLFGALKFGEFAGAPLDRGFRNVARWYDAFSQRPSAAD